MADKDNAEDLKLTLQDDGSAVVGGLADETPGKDTGTDKGVEGKADDEDKRLTGADDGHPDDEAGTDTETEAERLARTERNRARRKESKERRHEYIESLKRELSARDQIIDELSQRVSVVEQRSTGSEMAQLQAAEREAQEVYEQLKEANKVAIEQANGALANEVQERMFAVRQRIEGIARIKQGLGGKREQPRALDPRLVSNATDWMQRNSWYNPAGKDTDTRVVLALDAQLTQEGWNPTTPAYWQELDARVKKHLPHRINQRNNRAQDENPQGSPVAGSGRETNSASTSGGYKLSAERVQALKDAGMWDDPKQRADAIKRFQSYDKQKEQRA